MLTSVGANAVRAIRSQNRQNTPPPSQQAGIIKSGSAVRNSDFIRCGTAMPTKEIGPANAVTHAERTLESRISAARKCLIGTPRFCAYVSPS